MEAPQSPEVTALDSTAVLVKALADTRQELLSLAERCEAVVNNPISMPTALMILRSGAAHAREFLKK